MPDAHSSIVGGSSAARRLACPGSLELERRLPAGFDTSSEAAREGSALHAAMEWLLDTDEPRHARDLLARRFGGYLMTDQLIAEAIIPALTYFGSIVADAEYEVEVTAPFPGIEGAFGTTDIVAFPAPHRLIVFDWKFGKGVPVAAGGNPQLLFYAACTLERYQLWDTVKVVELAICQPRIGNSSVWITDVQTVRDFVADLQRALRGPPVIEMGAHCKFCPAMALCPAQQAHARRAHDWRVAAGEISQAMDMVPALEDWINSVKQAAHDALEAGQPIDGYKLVEKRTTRSWALDESEVIKVLTDAGLDLDTAAPRSVLSVAQAEKALKTIGSEVQKQYVRTSSSGTTVVPEDDKRPAINREGSAATETEKLAALIAKRKKEKA